MYWVRVGRCVVGEGWQVCVVGEGWQVCAW